jgi:hypothetical protein
LRGRGGEGERLLRLKEEGEGGKTRMTIGLCWQRRERET